MKHFLFSLVVLAATVLGLNAQTTLKTYDACDATLDEEVNVGDSEYVANHVLTATQSTNVVTAEQLNKVLQEINSKLNALEELRTRITAIENQLDAAIDPYNGHEYVDLGLSVKWASCNIGATKPEETGNYYAWGETQSKSTYKWSNYKWCNGTKNTITKYCTQSTYGKVDNKTTLDMEDDAARQIWKGAWRLPTRAEQDELRTKCTWTYTRQNNVYGYKVKGPNGNSIFLPICGIRDSEASLSMNEAHYLSSSLNTANSSCVYYIILTSSAYDWNGTSRHIGRSIRAVCK